MPAVLPLLASIVISAFPALASDPPISEVRISAPPGTRGDPAIASNGNGFLAVWLDQRGGSSKVLGQRLSSQGDPVEAIPFEIGTSRARSGSSVRVGWGNGSYLVVWECEDESARALCATPVTPDGVASPPRVVASGLVPAIAWNGDDWLLAYAASTIDAEIHVKLLAEDGAPKSETRSLGRGFAPAISSAAGRFLVSFHTASIRLRSVSGTGEPDSLPIVLRRVASPGSAREVASSSDGESHFVVWTRFEGFREIIEGARVSIDGERIGPIMTIVSGAQPVSRPAIAWTGRDYVLAFRQRTIEGMEDFRVAALHLTREGQPRESPLLLSTSEGSTPQLAVAANDGTAFALWKLVRDIGTGLQQGRPEQIAGMRVETDGVGEEVLISPSITWQERPAGRRGPHNFLFAWTELTGPSLQRQLFARIIAPDLHDGVDVPLPPSSRDRTMPSVSWDGDNYLLIWTESDRSEAAGRLSAVRVSPEGSVLDAQPIELGDATPGRSSAVAWNETAHLVVWTSGDGALVSTRVLPTGSLLDPAARVVASAAPFLEEAPSLAWNGSIFFLTWSSWQLHNCPILCPSRLPAVRYLTLSTDGLPMQPAPIVFAGKESGHSSVATNGEEFMMSWWAASEDEQPGIRVTRFSRDGSPIETAFVAQAFPSRTSVAWDGLRYTLVVGFSSNASVAVRTAMFPRGSLPSTFDLREFRTFPFREDLQPIAIAANGRTLVVYDREMRDWPYLGVQRLFLQYVAPPRSRALRR